MSEKLLAVETSSVHCSVAVTHGASLWSRHIEAPQRHGEIIYDLMDEILAESALDIKQIDAVAFGCGPGSFTGLRIAAAVSQAISFAQQIPVIPVSSLLALTADARAPYIFTAIDARMQEVYWAAYRKQDEGYVSLGNEQVSRPGKISIPQEWLDKTWLGLGNGFQIYKQELGRMLNFSAMQPQCHATAEAVARIARERFRRGKVKRAEEAIPVYIRNNVIG